MVFHFLFLPSFKVSGFSFCIIDSNDIMLDNRFYYLQPSWSKIKLKNHFFSYFLCFFELISSVFLIPNKRLRKGISFDIIEYYWIKTMSENLIWKYFLPKIFFWNFLSRFLFPALQSVWFLLFYSIKMTNNMYISYDFD